MTGDPDGLAGLIRAEKPRLVLLDLMLPGTDGIELMKQVPQLADLPVIFISGYGRDETIARAFESGAADYIVKPFSPTELVARVQAALRSRAEPETFVHGELAVDYDLRRVSVAGREVALTATEFDLLWTLSVNAGRVMTTEVLLRQVWGAAARTTPIACAPSSRSSAQSSATTPPRQPTSLPSTASATAWRRRARRRRPPGVWNRAVVPPVTPSRPRRDRRAGRGRRALRRARWRRGRPYGGQRQCQVEGNWNAVVRQDHGPERRQVLEPGSGEEDG